MGRSPRCEIGTMHERVAMPPTCTVHAPHALMPQPNFVPVSLRSSRNTQSSGVEGSTFTSRCSPLTVNLKVAMLVRLLFRARCAGLNPATRRGDEFVMRERRQSARRTVGTVTGIPRPLHERLFFVMFQQAWSIEVVVARAVGHGATDFSTRERAIVCVLPAHREGREVPVAAAGNSCAVRVRFLMAA